MDGSKERVFENRLQSLQTSPWAWAKYLNTKIFKRKIWLMVASPSSTFPRKKFKHFTSDTKYRQTFSNLSAKIWPAKSTLEIRTAQFSPLAGEAPPQSQSTLTICFKKSSEMSKKVSNSQRSQLQSYCAFTIRRLNACSRIKSSLWARGRRTPAQTPKPVPITYEGNLDNSEPWLFSWPFGKNCTNRIHRNILLCNKIF